MSFTIRHLLEEIPTQREMGISDQTVFEQFLGAVTIIISQHRVEAREVIINDLSEATEIEGLIDPSIQDRDINIWRWCALAFERQNDLVSAEKVIESCYNKMLELQLRHNTRFHKGTPLQTHGEILIRFGRFQRAKKYVILAHIEDIINGSPDAPAGQTLRLAGISNDDLEIIMNTAQEHIRENSDRQIFFPEEIYQKIIYKIEYGSIGELSRSSSYTNLIYLRELWNRVLQAAETDDNALKRQTLESLAQYLFSSVEGLFTKPSQRTGPYELDGIITNISTHPFLSRLDTYIPIECKNWADPIGSPEITQFIGKLNLFQCKYGILLSRNGIIENTVNELRKDAARRNDIYVFVFDEEDVLKIINGDDIISLIIEKYEELKFSIRM